MLVDNKPCHLIHDGDFSEVSKYVRFAKEMLKYCYGENLPSMYRQINDTTSIAVQNINNTVGKIYIKTGGCVSRFVGHQEGDSNVVIVNVSEGSSTLLTQTEYASTYSPMPLQYYSGDWNEYYPNTSKKINIESFRFVYYQNKWLYKQDGAINDLGSVIGAALTVSDDLFIAALKLEYISGQTTGTFQLCFAENPLAPTTTLPITATTPYISVSANTFLSLAGVSVLQRYSQDDLSYCSFSSDLDKLSFFMVSTINTGAILVEITNITKYLTEGLLFNCIQTNYKSQVTALNEVGANIGLSHTLVPSEWLVSHGYGPKGVATSIYWDQLEWSQTFSGNAPFNIPPPDISNQTASYTTSYRGKFKIGSIDLTPESTLFSSTSAEINGNTPNASGAESKTVNRSWWYLDEMDIRTGIYVLRHSQETSFTSVSYSGMDRRTIVSGSRVEDIYIACLRDDGTVNRTKVDTITTDLTSDITKVVGSTDIDYVISVFPETELVGHYIPPKMAASPCGWVYYRGKLYSKPSKNTNSFRVIDISTKYGLSKFVGKNNKEPPALI